MFSKLFGLFVSGSYERIVTTEFLRMRVQILRFSLRKSNWLLIYGWKLIGRYLLYVIMIGGNTRYIVRVLAFIFLMVL